MATTSVPPALGAAAAADSLGAVLGSVLAGAAVAGALLAGACVGAVVAV